MNRYLIEHRIKTLSKLEVGLRDGKKEPEMIIDSYIFSHWDFSYYDQDHKGDAWIVKKEILSDSMIKAIDQFREDLDKIVQKVAFVSQCYMDFYRESFLVYKIENNPDKIFLYKYVQEVEGNGLGFYEEELENYEKIKSFQYPGVFRFLQECCNTVGYIPRLLLLFSALESLCGKVEKENKEGQIYYTYDKDKMKKILDSNDFYDELFGKNGVRHKLVHGEMVNFVSGKNYVGEIYKKIIQYFNIEFKTNISQEVVNPQRHFYNNYAFINLWLKPKDKFEINLKNCFNQLDRGEYRTIEGVNGCERTRLDVDSY